MIFFTEMNRNRLISEPFPEQWREYLNAKFRVYKLLSDDDRRKLEDDLRIFIAEKLWEGCGGLELTDEMKVLISAQACLLNLHRQHNFYSNVQTVLVYPTAYRSRQKRMLPGGVYTEEESALLGESWQSGPIVLSWRDALDGAMDPDDGHDVVYHEFAHKLDGTDQEMDGVPLLENNDQVDDWAAVMSKEFEQFTERVHHGYKTLIDPYGATNGAEFFAVATETFFEEPVALRDSHPDLYRVLKGYYHQNPAEWFER